VRANAARLLRPYYLATPVFVLLDAGLGVNVRAAAFEASPELRYGYYAFLLLCAGLTLWRPALTGQVAFAESAISIFVLILGVVLPYANVLRALAAGATVRNPFTAAFVVNFVLSGTVALIAFHRVQPPERPTPR
jgi:hypothetical protein